MGLRILVVEDEWLIAEDLKERLIALGHEVLGPAPDCSSALEVLFRTRPDLAIVDTMLGAETCEVVLDELKAQEIPCVICSGHAPDMLPEFARPYPHLGKPYNQDGIAAALRS
jgi:DNA-binding response OmpR family regulator